LRIFTRKRLQYLQTFLHGTEECGIAPWSRVECLGGPAQGAERSLENGAPNPIRHVLAIERRNRHPIDAFLKRFKEPLELPFGDYELPIGSGKPLIHAATGIKEHQGYSTGSGPRGISGSSGSSTACSCSQWASENERQLLIAFSDRKPSFVQPDRFPPRIECRHVHPEAAEATAVNQARPAPEFKAHILSRRGHSDEDGDTGSEKMPDHSVRLSECRS
jgi:hypothetical protein